MCSLSSRTQALKLFSDTTTCNRDITNRYGLHLKELMDRLDLFQLCDEATHLNSSGEPTILLDLGFTILPCHVTICIQKDGHHPGWICRYFRGSRLAGKLKPDISRPGGKYRKKIFRLLLQGSLLSTTMGHCNLDLAAAVIWAIRSAWENNFPTFTVGMYRRGPGTPRQWM